ncbi:MAG: TraB/GumN family protein [bacterium]
MEYSANVHEIEHEGKRIVLVGTAHISRESVEEVSRVIEQEQPDAVCIELCAARYEALRYGDRWKEMDLFKVIRQGKAMLLLANLLMSAFQRRLGAQLGVEPGAEMVEAARVAEDLEAKIVLADRDVRVTLQRTWRRLSFWRKWKLSGQLMGSMFVDDPIQQEDIERMKQSDVLTDALETLASQAPEMKETLIDERDQYLAEKIRQTDSPKIVAVVGAGHVPGIKRELTKEHDLDELERVPPPGSLGTILKWGIPALIIGLIVYGFTMADTSVSWEMIERWFWINGSLAALGSALAFAHPLTIGSAFIAAPFTSLNPAVAAGWVAGLVEVLLRRPQVRDFEGLMTDVQEFKGFWRNKITRVLLVVVFANLGSTIGTITGGFAIASLL